MDGAIHHAVLEFNPCSDCAANTGSLDVYMDPPITPGIAYRSVPGTTPTLHIASVNLSDVVDASGNAFVGFTSATGAAFEQHDLLNWFFTPHTPTTAQEPLANGNTLFFFGQHQLTVTYPPSVPVPPGIDMMAWLESPNALGATAEFQMRGRPSSLELCDSLPSLHASGNGRRRRRLQPVNSFRVWQRVRESNPCTSLERAVS